MNRTMKKWLTVLLALAMLLALCACGGAAKDPKALMTAAEEKLSKAQSVSFDMEMEMVLTAQGETMDMGVTMKAETIKEPLTVHSNTHMGMFGLDTEIYLLQQDGVYTNYMGVKDGETTTWYKMAMNSEDLQDQYASYNADAFFSTQLDIAEDLTLVGTETVNNKKAVRYDGVIPADAIGQALDGSAGAGDTLELLGIDPSQVTKSVPISIWIYKDGMPAKYAFDMKDLLSEMLSQKEETAGISFTSMSVSMTITDVNTVKEITLPPEALDAQELTDEDLNTDPEVDEGLDLPWHEADLGDSITLTDGTEFAVSGVTVDDAAGTIRVDTGLADPAKAPLAALLCTDDANQYQLESYTVDETGNYVFSTEGHEGLSVYAVIFVDGDLETGDIWYVNAGISSES